MERDSPARKKRRQEKSSPKGDNYDVALESCVAAHLNKVKGDQSLGVFAVKLGIPKGSLARYLNCEQSMTLGTLQRIAKTLGIKPTSILSQPRK